MRIIAVLGRVLDPAGIVVNRRAGRVFVNREEYILQPADACALEAALRLKDAVGAEVIALPRALLPDDAAGAADVLRQALACGADRAIHLVGQADADDAVMACVLAAAMERLGGADLALTGATTLDTGQGQLGSRLAEALGWPQILASLQVSKTSASSVEPSASQQVQAVVQQEGGYVTVEADLPAVVTVAAGALKLRYPDGARLVNVYRDEHAVEKWEVADLVDVATLKPLVERRGQEFPPERERGARAGGTPEEMASTAADALRKWLPLNHDGRTASATT